MLERNRNFYYIVYRASKVVVRLNFIVVAMLILSFMSNGFSLNSNVQTSFLNSLNVVAILFMFMWIFFSVTMRHRNSYKTWKSLLFLAGDMFIITQIALFINRDVGFIKITLVPLIAVGAIALALGIFCLIKERRRKSEFTNEV